MASHPQISSAYRQGPPNQPFSRKEEKRLALEARQRRVQAEQRKEQAHLRPGFAAGPCKAWNANNPRGGDKSVRANFLRDHPTNSEAIMLMELRKYPGWGFTASQHLYGYIVDFYSKRFDLVIELDGCFHRGREAADAARDKHLSKRGIRTLRFPSSMVYTDLGGIIEAIRACAESLVTVHVAGPSGGTATEPSKQDVNLKASAGFATVNNGAMSGQSRLLA